MSCVPLEECSRQLTTGAYENAQLSRGKNLHEGAASSWCAVHDPHVPASAHGMCMCVMLSYLCVIACITCVYMLLFLPIQLCMRVFMIVRMCPCVTFVHLWHTQAMLSCPFKWVCMCDKRRLKKAWTVCFMLLFWTCEVCQHTTCSDFSCTRMRKYGAETYFSPDGICQVGKLFHSHL